MKGATEVIFVRATDQGTRRNRPRGVVSRECGDTYPRGKPIVYTRHIQHTTEYRFKKERYKYPIQVVVVRRRCAARPGNPNRDRGIEWEQITKNPNSEEEEEEEAEDKDEEEEEEEEEREREREEELEDTKEHTRSRDFRLKSLRKIIAGGGGIVLLVLLSRERQNKKKVFKKKGNKRKKKVKEESVKERQRDKARFFKARA
ncbi:hypothetical protein KQX54_001559 [Cotesia glomerata]|uniref:Uncharacterized protein n=1 Tax=Cotesia glomerata TaxID=32391 RepID=A0AAV7IKL4_COTGL|nr:hypothetical protein KQX54_001559 [Cotesia glomerata]